MVVLGTTALSFVSCTAGEGDALRLMYAGHELLLDRAAAPTSALGPGPEGIGQWLQWSLSPGSKPGEVEAHAAFQGAGPPRADRDEGRGAASRTPPALERLTRPGAGDEAVFGAEARHVHLLYVATTVLGLLLLLLPLRQVGLLLAGVLGLGALVTFLHLFADRFEALGFAMRLETGAFLALLGFGLAILGGALQLLSAGPRSTPPGTHAAPPMADVRHPESPEDRGRVSPGPGQPGP